MALFRSGIRKAVFVVCEKPIKEADFSFVPGERYEYVLDMGALLVIKKPNGQDCIVPKEAFKVVED